MEALVGMAVAMAIVALVGLIVWEFSPENEPSQIEVTNNDVVEIKEVNTPIYDALLLLISSPSETVTSEIMKYVTRTITKGCEEIKQNTPNVMLCGVRVKEHIANSRNIYKENSILYASSGLNREGYDKLIDGVCLSIYDNYFKDLA